jgi:hypothetical protein
MNGYVAADTGINGVTGPAADVRNSGPNYLQTRFKQELPFKNAPFTLTPDPNGQYVYQDELVNGVVQNACKRGNTSGGGWRTCTAICTEMAKGCYPPLNQASIGP